MISLTTYLFEKDDMGQTGGMLTRTITTIAAPIPGAGIALGPVASISGEMIGSKLPKMKTPKFVKDSEKVYNAGGDSNKSFKIQDQVDVRKNYAKKAKELGYDKVGQTIAAIDPGLLMITPKKFL